MMRVLMLTQRLPYAPNRGDRLRVYHMLRHLRHRCRVDLVSLVHDEDEAAHVDDVRALVSTVTALPVSKWQRARNAVMALATGRPLTHALLDAPGMRAALTRTCALHPPEVVFAYGSGMARFAMEPPLNHYPLVLDFVDVDSRKWRDLATSGTLPLSLIHRREAATLGAFEARAATTATTSLVVNGREAENARELAPAANITVLPNGVEIERLCPPIPPTAKPRIVFCGVMNYAPNAEGMMWFVERVWPLVKAQCPDATLSVVGPDPSPAFQAKCAGDASITVAGRVADVRDWLWSSAIGIAPLHVARGVQNKALEAIAAGLPIVITEAVAAGLPANAASASRVANTPRRFADHLVDLLALSPEQRRAMARSADFTEFTWPRTLTPLVPILERAAARGVAPAADGTAVTIAPVPRSIG